MKTISLLMSALLFAAAPVALAQEGEAAPEGDAPAAEPAAPVVMNFNLDAGKTSIYATTKKDGVGAALAHDHVIMATQQSGKISFSETDASANRIEITIDVNSMSVDQPAHRKKASLEGEVSEGDRESVKKNMLADDQLAGAKHPKMTFTSTSITPQGGGKYTVEGNLTIRGVTQKVSFPATVSVEGGAFHGSGSLKITHTQFGFEPYSAAFGAIKNNDTITLHLDIWGSK